MSALTEQDHEDIRAIAEFTAKAFAPLEARLAEHYLDE